MAGTLFVISAPSGTGKTTLVNAIIAGWNYPKKLKKIITYTTKTPRPDEINGRDYFFISVDEFKAKIAQGFFFEWSIAYNDYYGSPQIQLENLEDNTLYIIILDRDGASAIKKSSIKSVLIWIEPPSLPDLRQRLLSRAADSPESIKHRLSLAQVEMQQEVKDPLFDYILINTDFTQTRLKLQEILEQYAC